MASKVSFPKFLSLRVEGYKLFPGDPAGTGINFSFTDGASLIAGINGLGKTTLITMLFRLLVGPYELPKDDSTRTFGAGARQNVVPWPARRRYFTQRVSDRAQTATATLVFQLGSKKFSVKRELTGCKLLSATLDGAPIEPSTEEAYQSRLVTNSSVGSFADFLTVAKYLTFFNEDRRNILWDAQAQRQFLRILFLTPDDSRKWAALEKSIGQHDSAARNWSANAFKMQRELDELEADFLTNANVGAELSVKQKMLTADLEAKQELDDQLSELDAQLNEIRRSLERAKIYEDDAEQELDSIRYSAIERLFPKLGDTAKYVLTHLFSEGRCLACEADAPEERRKFEQMLETGDCAVCGAHPEQQRLLPVGVGVAPPTELERKRLNKARDAYDKARTMRLADAQEEKRLEHVRTQVLEEMGRRSRDIAQLQLDTESLRARLPPTPDELENRRKAIAGMRSSQKREETLRAEAELEYGKLIAGLNDTIRKGTSEIADKFSDFATEFLEEKCTLTFRMISARPSQGGRSFEYPALKFEMSAASFTGLQIRETPDDVSESQREFIDLAFRMALMIVSNKDGPATLVMETPEASLDVIFMTKAAELLLDFAQNGRRVVVTSNLTNSALIPSLMGGKPKKNEDLSRRWDRVLNLLEVAEPNAALRHFKPKYKKFLADAIEGRDAN